MVTYNMFNCGKVKNNEVQGYLFFTPMSRLGAIFFALAHQENQNVLESELESESEILVLESESGSLYKTMAKYQQAGIGIGINGIDQESKWNQMISC